MTTEAQAAETSKPNVEKVQMEDGSTVEFVGEKRKMLKDAKFDDAGNWISTRFDFKDGRQITFDPTKLDPRLIQRLAAHGADQKLGDEAAGEKTVGDMYEAVLNMANRLTENGLEGWKIQREGGGFAGTSVLLRALVQFTGKPVEAIRAFLKDKTKPQKDAMRASDHLRPIVQQIEAEDAAKAGHVDVSGLLQELEAA